MREKLILCILIIGVIVVPVVSGGVHPKPGDVCLVLGGGGARGLAHIGVLKALEEEGLTPDCIVGNSSGAMIGSLYCAGYSAHEIEELFLNVDLPNMINDFPNRKYVDYDGKKSPKTLSIKAEFRQSSIHFPMGLISGQKIRKELSLAYTRIGVQDIHDFDHLPIPFRCVATDLKRSKIHVFEKGNLSNAVRASIAIPMVFDPVLLDDMVLVDGMVLNNIPVDIAKSMGYQNIIAVNVTGNLPPEAKQLNNFIQILDESMTMARYEKDQRLLAEADIALLPDVLGYSVSDFNLTEDIMQKGYECARTHMKELTMLFHASTKKQPPIRPIQWKYDVPLTDIGVKGTRRKSHRDVLRKSRASVGKPLSLEQVDESIDNIYALDKYQFVDYEMLYHTGVAQLNYIVEEKPKSSLSVSLHYDSDYQILGNGKFLHRNIFGTSSDLSIELLVGQLKNARISLESPFPLWSALNLKSQIYFTATPHKVLKEDTLMEVFREKHYGISAGTVLNLGHTAGIYSSFHAEFIDTVSIGYFDEKEKTKNTFFRFGAGIDTLDRWFFPESGIALDAYVEKGFRFLGTDLDYTQVRGISEFYLPITRNNVMHLSGSVSYSWNIPSYLVYFAGGQNYMTQSSQPLPGYAVDELYGKDIWRTEIEFRRKFSKEMLGMIDASYLFFKYGVAGVRLPEVVGDTLNLNTPYQFFHGVGMGVAVSSLMGPMRVFVGIGESGRFRWIISIGPDF